MKVIFLDIDGVLNSARSFIANHPRDNVSPWKTVDERNIATIDPIAVKMINEIAYRCEAEIVVSSSHRKWFYVSSGNMQLGPVVDLPSLIDYMRNLGIEKDVIDATPVLHGKFRGDEIATWLSNHPEVTKYVILDDDSDMTDEQLEKHFVKTDSYDGFLFANYEKTVSILGLKENEKDIFVIPAGRI